MKKKLILTFLSIFLGVFCVIMIIDIDLLPFIIPWRQHKVYEKYYQESYSNRANILVKQKKYLEAADVLKEGLELVTNTDLTSNIIRIHEKIIDLCLDAKDFDRAKYELKKLVSLTQRNQEIQQIHCAVLYYSYKINDPELTKQYTNDIINYHLKALDKYVKNKSANEYPNERIYELVGSCKLYSFFYILRHIEDSERALKIAKNILSLSKNESSPYRRLRPYAYKEFIYFLCNTDRHSLAIKSLQKTIKNSVELKVKIESYIKLAEIYKGYLEQNSMAIRALKKTMELIDKTTAPPDKQARYYRRAGRIFFHCKEPSKAISCFQKAALCSQDFKDKIDARLAIIRVNINVKRYSAAKNKIEEISRDILQKDVKRCSKTYCLDSIVNLYAKMKAYDSGITTLQKLKAKAKNQDDKSLLKEYVNKLKNLKKRA